MSNKQQAFEPIELPELETYLANAILRCLRKWKEQNDKSFDGKPINRSWIVDDCDIDYLEEWVVSLWKMWQDTQDSAVKAGLTVIEQPSVISSRD